MIQYRLKEKIRGSIVGGAVGDALGYPVEFWPLSSIKKKFGEKGITSYVLQENGKAVISDDTQMTLFTANGLLNGLANADKYGDLTSAVVEAYGEWYQTQNPESKDLHAPHACWIRDIEELNVCRAPGLTCLDALRDVAHVRNNSKGCGGIMRVAPVALALYAQNQRLAANRDCELESLYSRETIAKLGGDCAAITHNHPLGYMSAALFVDVLYQLMSSRGTFGEFAVDIMYRMTEVAMKRLSSIYTKEREVEELANLKSITDQAIRLAMSDVADEEAIAQLGEGWVAEEAWAIALYCVMKHPDSFEDAIIASVNHSGDSDSTGSICGNLMGAIVGYDGIPDKFLKDLELKDVMLSLSDDMECGCTLHKPCYYSYAVNDWLFAGEYPGDKDEAAAQGKLDKFERFGITHFIDLTEDGELRPYAHLLPSTVKHRRFPIKDVNIPDSIEAVKDLIAEIKQIHDADPEAKVYVHCWGGVGRTGTIIGCFLADQMKQDYVEVTNVLRRLWSDCPKSKWRDSPETRLQHWFIRNYALTCLK